MRSRAGFPGEDGSDGFVLVAVLWILGALATLSSVCAVHVANTAIAVAANDDNIRVQALSSAAVELAAYQLLAAPAEHRPTRGAFDVRMESASLSVEFRTETARVDLNGASKELLAGLFTALGAHPNDAPRYADRIVGWRSTPASGSQDGEGSLYRAAGLAYGPRGAPFAHVGELSLVLGLPPALVERARPYVTVFSGQAGVNVVEAAPEVIAALPGMTPERLDGVLAQRAALKDGDSLAALLGPAQSAATTGAGRATRVNVRIALDNGRRAATEAVILIDGRDEPYRVLAWSDDSDGPVDPVPGAGARR